MVFMFIVPQKILKCHEYSSSESTIGLQVSAEACVRILLPQQACGSVSTGDTAEGAQKLQPEAPWQSGEEVRRGRFSSDPLSSQVVADAGALFLHP